MFSSEGRGLNRDIAAEATVANPGTAGAYTDEVDAVVLLDAHNNSAAVAVAAQLAGVFGGRLQACRLHAATGAMGSQRCGGL